jgi:acyl-coenzyme A thioesterase PaaI-like protein
MHPGKVVQGGVVTAYGDVCMALAAHTLFDHGEVSLDLVHHRQLPRARDRITVHRAADGASWDWEFDGVVDVEALVAKASPESTGPSLLDRPH